MLEKIVPKHLIQNGVFVIFALYMHGDGDLYAWDINIFEEKEVAEQFIEQMTLFADKKATFDDLASHPDTDWSDYLVVDAVYRWENYAKLQSIAPFVIYEGALIPTNLNTFNY